jgi:hypothetical protein
MRGQFDQRILLLVKIYTIKLLIRIYTVSSLLKFQSTHLSTTNAGGRNSEIFYIYSFALFVNTSVCTPTGGNN